MVLSPAVSSEHNIIFICRPDAVVDPWLKQLWEKVLKMYPLPPGKEIISASQRSASCLNELHVVANYIINDIELRCYD